MLFFCGENQTPCREKVFCLERISFLVEGERCHACLLRDRQIAVFGDMFLIIQTKFEIVS